MMEDGNDGKDTYTVNGLKSLLRYVAHPKIAPP